MILFDELPELIFTSSSDRDSLTTATPVDSSDLSSSSRGISFEELQNLPQEPPTDTTRLKTISPRTSTPETTPETPPQSRPSSSKLQPGTPDTPIWTSTQCIWFLILFTVVSPALGVFLRFEFNNPSYRGVGDNSTLGWSHKPVVSPSCRVARKYTIDPDSLPVASSVLDCEVPGYGARVGGDDHHIADAVKALSHVPDRLFQAQNLIHRYHRDLGALAVEYEFPISPQSISASSIDLLTDAMTSYYIHIHRMLCQIRDTSNGTLNSQAQVAPFTLTWYNNKVYRDLVTSIAALETAEMIIRGRHTECREIMYMSLTSMALEVVFSEWSLTDTLEGILIESLSLLDQIDQAIKTGIASLKTVEQSMSFVDPLSEEIHTVSHIHISNLLVDVEETSRLSSALVVRMENQWKNSTFKR
ncbi:unnamed protein product [Aureobasidium mustum]|uniref:Uncharacterized protein n=1 Tax=Aureobasidium mustum TaxID=2773714 RepID=A0A9N8PMA5_9PEZI|nr:unnamed protein product [Aureobasidium mustum]